MKVVIASDSYKECASSLHIASLVETGFSKVFPNSEFKSFSMADGGEGTVDALIDASNGSKVVVNANDPLGREVETYYGISGDKSTAFIEMAKISGLELLSEDEKNPMLTSTYGTGQLIKHAYKNGVKHLIIGIGGSATCDAGMGMACALGYKFYDSNNNLLKPSGYNMGLIERICDEDYILKDSSLDINVACDVDNPLYGINGASHVYNRQKGAGEEMVISLDESLKHFGDLTNTDVNLKGAGAAGGLGFGLVHFLGAKLKPGVDIIIDYIKLEDAISDADVVITGEGMTDFQSVMGKAPAGVGKLASKYNVPVLLISGALGDRYEDIYDHGIAAAFSPIVKPCSLKEAIANTDDAIINQAYSLAKTIEIGMYIDK